MRSGACRNATDGGGARACAATAPVAVFSSSACCSQRGRHLCAPAHYQRCAQMHIRILMVANRAAVRTGGARECISLLPRAQHSTIDNVDRFIRLKSLVLDNNCISSIKNLRDVPKNTFHQLETLWL